MVVVLRSLFALLMRRDLGVRADIAAGVLVDLVGIALGVAAPYLLKLLVDRLTDHAIAPLPLVVLTAGFVLAWSGTNLTAAVKYVFSSRVIYAASRRMTEAAVAGCLPAVARERQADSGRLLGTLERLPFSLMLVIDGLIGRAAPLLAQVAISLVVMATLVPWPYVVLMMLVLGGYLAATRLSAARFRQQTEATNKAMAAVSQTLGDVLRNARRVIFNGNLDAEVAEIGRDALAKQWANERLAWLLVRTASTQFLVVGAGLVLLLALSAFDTLRGAITVGDFVLLQAYAFRLAVPLGGLGFILRQAGVGIINIGEVQALAGSTPPAAQPPARDRTAARLTLERVGFRYGEDWVVREANVEIAPGSFVVVAGPNGAGKSTLARIMAGLLDPHAGRALVDGEPLATIAETERHGRVLYVPQFIGLFNRSLGANALYPPTGQSEAELRALLEDWRFYEDGRPVDFRLSVGEQGERLSGGQVQKLELARLMGVPAPAIILDETTSSLDAPAEKRAIDALRARHAGRTTLVLITHRLALAREADQVLFMRQGRLIAGQHRTLLVADPNYRHFCAGAPEAAA